jgi:hypothetical protein
MIIVVAEASSDEPSGPGPDPTGGPTSFWTGLALGLLIALVAVSVVLYLYKRREG